MHRSHVIADLQSSTEELFERTVIERVHELLTSARNADLRTQHLLDALQHLGPYAVFGGAVRDMWFERAAEFDSDVDLVIDVDDIGRLYDELAPLRPQSNRYGGLRFKFGAWTFDVWSLADTWAIRKGYVSDVSFDGLLRTTFFNWDAIAMHVQADALLFDPGYYQALISRILDINLEVSANPQGNALRALRMIQSRNALIGPRLARYIDSHLDGMMGTERGLAGVAEVVDVKFAEQVWKQLSAHLLTAPASPFVFRKM